MSFCHLFNLDDKVVVITGAGGHLCSEMVRGFASAGCCVCILDIRLEKAQAVEADYVKMILINFYLCPLMSPTNNIISMP